MVNKKNIVTAVCTSALLLFSACGGNENSGDDREYKLTVSTVEDKTNGVVKSFKFEYELFKNETGSILQIVPSSLGIRAPQFEGIHYDSNFTYENFCYSSVVNFSSDQCDEYIKRNEFKLKNFPKTVVLSGIDVLPTTKSIECNRTTELNSSSEDVNYTCITQDSYLQSLDSNYSAAEQNITLTNEPYKILYFSNRLGATLVPSYEIEDNNLTKR